MVDDRPLGLEDLSDFDIAWPQHSDTLKSSGDGARDIPVGDIHSGDYQLMMGYRNAALILGERLRRGDRAEAALFSPYAHCWRHHLELQMKMLIQDSARMYRESVSLNLSTTHSLGKLWNTARSYIKRTFPDDASADTRVPNRIVTQLSQLDPDGVAFRYSKTIGGKAALAGFRWIEIKPFHTSLLNLSAYLNGAIEGTAWLQDQQPTPDDYY